MRSKKVIGYVILAVVALSTLTALPAVEGLTIPSNWSGFEGTPTYRYSHVLSISINATIRLFNKLNVSADSPAWQKLKTINASVEVIKNYEKSGNYTAAYSEFKKALDELHQLVKDVIAEYVQKGKATLRAGLAGVLAEAEALNITANHLLKAIKKAEDKGLINSSQADKLRTEVEAQIKVLDNISAEVNLTVSTGGVTNVNMTQYKDILRNVVHALNQIRFELNKAASHYVGSKVSSAIKALISKLQAEVSKLRNEARKLGAEGNNISAQKLLGLSNNISGFIKSVKANISLKGNETELLRALRRMEAYIFALRGVGIRVRTELSILPGLHNATLELMTLRNESRQLRELAQEIRVLVNGCVTEANKTSAQMPHGWGPGGGSNKTCSDCGKMLNLSISINASVWKITNLTDIEMNSTLKGKGRALSELIEAMNRNRDKIYTEIGELRNLVLKDCTIVDPNSTKTILTDLQMLSIKLHKFEGDLKRVAATINVTSQMSGSSSSEAAKGLINASVKILYSVQKQMTLSNCSKVALNLVNESINYLLKAQTSLKSNNSAQALSYVRESINSLKATLSNIQGKCIYPNEFSISVKIEVSMHLLIMVENSLS